MVHVMHIKIYLETTTTRHLLLDHAIHVLQCSLSQPRNLVFPSRKFFGSFLCCIFRKREPEVLNCVLDIRLLWYPALKSNAMGELGHFILLFGNLINTATNEKTFCYLVVT